MSAPKGSQFWKNRSKHGRDILFTSPELMWSAACEYFEWCDENPLFKQDWVGKDAMEVERRLGRPYTITGLCLYLDCNTKYFTEFKKNTNHQNFSEVITRIEETVYTQKFEGASVGVFNANIISRDLGLADRSEMTGKDGESLFKNHTDEELAAMVAKLNARLLE